MASGKSYRHISPPLSIRKLGEDLLNGGTRYVAGIHNIEGVHWTAFVVDRQQKEIRIGDSLTRNSGNSRSSSKYGLLSSLQWWIQQSDCLGLPSPYFECKELEVNSQVDFDSCGIFAYNALHHFVSPAEVPKCRCYSVVQLLIFDSGWASNYQSPQPSTGHGMFVFCVSGVTFLWVNQTYADNGPIPGSTASTLDESDEAVESEESAVPSWLTSAAPSDSEGDSANGREVSTHPRKRQCLDLRIDSTTASKKGILAPPVPIPEAEKA